MSSPSTSSQSKPTALDLASTFTSESYSLANIREFSLQVDYPDATSPVGTFKLQALNKGASSWIDIPDSSQAITDAGSIMWHHVRAAFAFVRVSYTRVSGSGTAYVYLTGKH